MVADAKRPLASLFKVRTEEVKSLIRLENTRTEGLFWFALGEPAKLQFSIFAVLFPNPLPFNGLDKLPKLYKLPEVVA